jgi:hypothetical protein
VQNNKHHTLTKEELRLREARDNKIPWRRWGPYLSERQWGTVREDYSPDGTAWEYLPHDHARSRAYRWGEEGIAGISDEKQHLCFALSLWNGKDPILKERLFGLTGNEGNHGEDVKEYYFYLDNLPSHAYMKYLYKYPQNEYPYQDLVETNKQRTREEFEYELLDTKIFDDDRYFDIFVEYAKAASDEICIRYTIANRGPDKANLHLLPTLWFRNTWSWAERHAKPSLTQENSNLIRAEHSELGTYWLHCDDSEALLFTENETNTERLFDTSNGSPYVKDGINACIVNGKTNKVNPHNVGTKASVLYNLSLLPGETKQIKLYLSANREAPKTSDALFEQRKKEADEFYHRITPYPLTEDMRNVQRQAFAGLLWNKQFYHYAVKKWIEGDPKQPKPPEGRKFGRNHDWPFLDANDIFSMPDKWEYPWFAAWDLSFHTIPLAMIDPEFAKKQLILLTREWYMAPNGQIPAYEWSFSDVNPPVQAWAAMRVYQIEHAMYGRKDTLFLERMFQKLSLNFTWWVNRKDANGKNVFEGGFLGLDNIGAFDRTNGLPQGSILKQPDGTGWMAMYCLNLLQMALELSAKDSSYEDMATKFFEHFVLIADAINGDAGGEESLWNDESQFYNGLLILPNGSYMKMNQYNMAGLVPLFAVVTNESKLTDRFPHYRRHFNWFVENRPEMLQNIADLSKLNAEGRFLLSITNEKKLRELLVKVLDEQQFLSSYGVRSVSKVHAEHPFVINLQGNEFRLDYEPAESTTGLFGGNSNWRGPIWLPLNFLIIESLQKFHYYYNDDFMIDLPTGSKEKANLWDASAEITSRLISIFLKDKDNRRPLYGGIEKFQTDPHWRDYILFHEYFHGDNGAGLGASNQTGWTGLIAKLIHQHGKFTLQHESVKRIEREKIGHA